VQKLDFTHLNANAECFRCLRMTSCIERTEILLTKIKNLTQDSIHKTKFVLEAIN